MEPIANGNGTLSDAGEASHAVQFYQSRDFLFDSVARFLATGITADRPALVIATRPHAHGFERRLRRLGVDPAAAERSGRLIFLDAHETLATFMDGSYPDPHRFTESLGGTLRRIARAAPASTVCAYGEMVDVLWREGNADAAIRVEELWNELAVHHSFSLLCAYHLESFGRESDGAPLHEICDRHSHVHPAEGFDPDAREDARAREITRLQQRAVALETEIAHREELERSLREALAERERIEASLRASKEAAETASRAKSDFLAVMSHELRTPLHSILGFHGLLALGVEGSEQEPYLDGIERGATELLGLIDQVLNLSTLEGGHVVAEREPVDLVGVAQEAGRLIAPSTVGKGLVLAIDLPKGPFICQTDGDKLRQILLNLLSNAVKFTENGTVGCDLEIEADFAYFRVRDTGVGILPADLDRIFEPFTQTDTSTTRAHRGTGLGLSISRNLARLLGGELEAESRPGEGSVFSLRIPRDPAALRAT